MLKRIPDPVEGEKRTRNIVVVYENPASRELAADFLQQCTEHQRSSAGLNVRWWPFNQLTTSTQATEAARAAADADMIVFAMDSSGDLPRDTKLWIDSWLDKRSKREGAIAGLVSRTAGQIHVASLKEVYLRHVAHRAGMDYLSHASPTALRAMPDSLESYRQRARQMTSVLDEILHKHQVPLAPRL